MSTQPTEQQTKEILERLEELHKKATPGPWPDPDDESADIEISSEEMEHNKRFIYALHNAFPLLLSLSLSSRTLTAEAELQKARERIAVLQSQVDNADVNLEQVRSIWKSRAEKAEVELAAEREKIAEMADTTRKAMQGLLSATVDRIEKEEQHAEMAAEVSTMLTELNDLKTENASLRSTVARMEGALKDLLFAHENSDETGYVTDVGFLNLDEICKAAHAALQPAQSASPLAQTAMDWDERLPYVPEKKTEGLPAQSAAKVEELSEQKHVRVCVHGISEHRYCPTCSPWKRSWDSLDDRQPTPPQEQKTGGGEAYEKEWIELNAAYNWLWQNCRIVFWPKAPDYPIEHNPHARKESRGLIEYHMTKALGQANHPTQPEVETVGWKDICTAPDVKGQYFFCRLAWGPDDDKTTADGFRWNGRWFAAPTFHAERSADGCQIQMRQVEVYPSHWMPEPAAPLSTQSPQPKEEQSHEA